MTAALTWYAIGRNVYARRGPSDHDRDPQVALCASAQLADLIALTHNLNTSARPATATRIVPRTRHTQPTEATT